jgi:hypothetical protein
MNASIQSGERLNDILRIYSEYSGQCVNREKSSIFFSPNTPDSKRLALKQLLGISVEALSERYWAYQRLLVGLLMDPLTMLLIVFLEGFKDVKECYPVLVGRFFLKWLFMPFQYIA